MIRTGTGRISGTRPLINSPVAELGCPVTGIFFFVILLWLIGRNGRPEPLIQFTRLRSYHMNFNPMLADRHTRSPKHTFAVESRPWEITPCLIAPVLPGETLDGLTLQSRVVTPPIKSRVVGWWLEYFIFYVPFRQMPSAANLVAMFVDPTVILSPSAVMGRSYYAGLGFDFVSECLQVVTQEWFRREGESWSAFVIRANQPAASTNKDDFGESLIDNSVLPSGGAIAGMNVDDLDRARMVLEYRRQLQMLGSDGGQVDYEEVLASYGASIRAAKRRDRPELIRYIRDWSYPVNTVEPTTGVPSTAVSWAITDRADKGRKFNEPGFIFGVQVCRPKVYYGRQESNASTMLDRAQRWLPPTMDETGAERSLAEFLTTEGPYGRASGGFTNGYWLDVRDLFNYGDQFITTGLLESNVIALPRAGALSYRYADTAMADGLQDTVGQLIVGDGSVQLRVKTRTVDPS